MDSCFVSHHPQWQNLFELPSWTMAHPWAIRSEKVSMKKYLWIGLFSAMAGTLSAAESGAKDKIVAAAKKLGDSANYSWTTTPNDESSSTGRNIGPIEGKTEKDGFTYLMLMPGGISVD